jgi:hypothetical protein
MMRREPFAGHSKQKGADRRTTQDASFAAINAFRKWKGPVRLNRLPAHIGAGHPVHFGY